MKYKVKLTLGDWSEDGHEKSIEYIYLSNYPVEKIRQAYKDSCKLTGISFNHDEDYTGLALTYGSDRQVWTGYEDSGISDTAYAILSKFGIIAENDDIDPDFINPGEGADIIMKFISLSMPKDWSYSSLDNDIESINGWWNKELNVQFGYGLFD